MEVVVANDVGFDMGRDLDFVDVSKTTFSNVFQDNSLVGANGQLRAGREFFQKIVHEKQAEEQQQRGKNNCSYCLHRKWRNVGKLFSELESHSWRVGPGWVAKKRHGR